MKAFNGANPFKVGDILHHQLTYTMSFPLFYKVVAVTAKTVTVREIGKTMWDNYDGYGQAGTYVPDDYNYRSTQKKCKLVEHWNGAPAALVNSHHGWSAALWDGKPKEFYGD